MGKGGPLESAFSGTQKVGDFLAVTLFQDHRAQGSVDTATIQTLRGRSDASSSNNKGSRHIK